MYFFDKFNEMEIKHLLSSTKSFFYLKGATGSTSKSTFIINDYSEIDKIIKANTQIKNWFLSENINSYLYKRKGSYQPNGIVYNEKLGHKGRLKFFILFKILSNIYIILLSVLSKSCILFSVLLYEFTAFQVMVI